MKFPLRFSEILQAHPKNNRSQASVLISIPASKCNAGFKIIQDCFQLKFRQSKAVQSQQDRCVHSHPKKKVCTPSHIYQRYFIFCRLINYNVCTAIYYIPFINYFNQVGLIDFSIQTSTCLQRGALAVCMQPKSGN